MSTENFLKFLQIVDVVMLFGIKYNMNVVLLLFVSLLCIVKPCNIISKFKYIDIHIFVVINLVWIECFNTESQFPFVLFLFPAVYTPIMSVFSSDVIFATIFSSTIILYACRQNQTSWLWIQTDAASNCHHESFFLLPFKLLNREIDYLPDYWLKSKSSKYIMCTVLNSTDNYPTVRIQTNEYLCNIFV